MKRAIEILLENNEFLILTHRKPDGDTTGSAVALCEGLRSLGKTAYLLEDHGMTEKYRVYAMEYYAPKGFEPKCVVAVDIASGKLLPEDALCYSDDILLAIDHHVVHVPFSKERYVDPSSAACGEAIYDVLMGLGVQFNQTMAEALYIAISTDTGCFLYSNTTARTHAIAAKLIEAGADIYPINRKFFIVKSASRIQIESYLSRNMKFYYDGKVAVLKIDKRLEKRLNAREDDMDNIASMTRQIEGVEVGVLIRENNFGELKVSLRSSGKIDVSEICVSLGGGGHKAAAGYTTLLTQTKAEKQIVELLESVV